MTLFWKYVPVEHSASLGYPSPEPVGPLGPAPLTIVLTPSLIALLGKEPAGKGAKPAPLALPLARPTQSLAPFFLSFPFLWSFFLPRARFPC